MRSTMKVFAVAMVVLGALSGNAPAEPRFPCEKDPSRCSAQAPTATGGCALGASTASDPSVFPRQDDPRPRMMRKVERKHGQGRESTEVVVGPVYED